MAVQEAGLMRRVPGRCMLGVHNLSDTSIPTRPKERQGSAWAAHREVRIVLVLIWGLVPLGAAWGAIVYIFIQKGENGALPGNNWSLFPTVNGFRGGTNQAYDEHATPTLNFGWGPPSSEYDYDDGLISLLWTLVFVSGLQIPLTLALHCAELETTLSRDEAVWRRATSRRGCDPTYDSTCAAATSWQSVGLILFKAILHWIFGLSITVYSGAGANMRPPQIFYLTVGATVFALFITYVSARRPKGPQPAAYGHLQTLINLIDEPCPNIYWGHKEDGVICHAGTGPRPLPPVKLDALYR
jgi:hypothetical protein